MQQAKLPKADGATKADCRFAAELLMKALAERGVAFDFTTNRYFQAFVSFVSKKRHSAPSRYELVKALDDITERISQKLREMLERTAFVGICVDAWTKAGRHLSAVTGGSPGISALLNAYETHGADNAENTAIAIIDCVLSAMGHDPDMPTEHASFPTAKVSVITTDTTNMMPAMARLLAEHPLCLGAVWARCFAHVGNLLLLDQLKVHSVGQLLAHCTQAVRVFRIPAIRKLFLMCDSPTSALMHVNELCICNPCIVTQPATNSRTCLCL